jgi:putative tricarboxylic transport membrane protein
MPGSRRGGAVVPAARRSGPPAARPSPAPIPLRAALGRVTARLAGGGAFTNRAISAIRPPTGPGLEGPAIVNLPTVIVRAPQNLAAGASLLALSAFALWAVRDLPSGTLRAMGPGMMPRAAAVLLGVAGGGLAVAALLREGERLQRWSWRGPLFITLAVVGFALTIRAPGLVVAGPLVAVVGGAASAEARPRELVVFGVLVTAFCIALFRYALQLPIPVLVLPGLVVV